MRTLMKLLGTVVLLIVLAFVAMYALGSRLPREHTANGTATIAARQDVVWHLITDVGAQPMWRTGLKAVQLGPDQGGRPCWTETNSMGKMPMCEVMSAPPTVRIVRIADPNLPFGGSWTYELNGMGPHETRVTITENGTTGPAIWRFLGHYVFHEDTSIKQYLKDLQAAGARS